MMILLKVLTSLKLSVLLLFPLLLPAKILSAEEALSIPRVFRWTRFVSKKGRRLAILVATSIVILYSRVLTNVSGDTRISHQQKMSTRRLIT
jgi:hypothetical protein